ncbi:MAG: Ig-like domain-containing protein, partial [Pseudohongiellaceae bacterium]
TGDKICAASLAANKAGVCEGDTIIYTLTATPPPMSDLTVRLGQLATNVSSDPGLDYGIPDPNHSYVISPNHNMNALVVIMAGQATATHEVGLGDGMGDDPPGGHYVEINCLDLTDGSTGCLTNAGIPNLYTMVATTRGGQPGGSEPVVTPLSPGSSNCDGGAGGDGDESSECLVRIHPVTPPTTAPTLTVQVSGDRRGKVAVYRVDFSGGAISGLTLQAVISDTRVFDFGAGAAFSFLAVAHPDSGMASGLVRNCDVVGNSNEADFALGLYNVATDLGITMSDFVTGNACDQSLTDAAATVAFNRTIRFTFTDPAASSTPVVSLETFDDGGVKGDNITNDNTPQINVSNLASGATVSITGTHDGDASDVTTGGLPLTTVAGYTFLDDSFNQIELADGVWTIEVTHSETGKTPASATLVIEIDTVPPTVSHTPLTAAYETTALVTFTFSEDVVGVGSLLTMPFGLDGLGGRVSDFRRVSGSVYTYLWQVPDEATFLAFPTSGVNEGSIFGVEYTDIAGNAGTNYLIKVTGIMGDPSAKPTVDLTDASDTGSSNTDNITNDNSPTFTIGGLVSGAIVTVDADITVDLDTGPIRRRKTITAAGPTATVEFGTPGVGGDECELITVNRPGSGFGGNTQCTLNAGGAPNNGEWTITATQTEPGMAATASDPLTLIFDTMGPTLRTISPARVMQGEVSQLTFIWSEPVTDFTLSDIRTVTPIDSFSNFGGSSGDTEYTVDITASNRNENTIIVISADEVTDLAGNPSINPNNPATDDNAQSILFVPEVPPTVSISVTNTSDTPITTIAESDNSVIRLVVTSDKPAPSGGLGVLVRSGGQGFDTASPPTGFTCISPAANAYECDATVTIAAGSTSQTHDVQLYNDSDQGDKEAAFHVITGSGYTPGTPSVVTITITDDGDLAPSAAPAVNLADASDSEPDDKFSTAGSISDNITNDNTPTIALTDLVAGALVVVVATHTDGSVETRTIGSAVGVPATVIFPTLKDGVWTVVGHQTEPGKAAAPSAELIITIDTTPPTITLNEPNTETAQSKVISATSSDDGSTPVMKVRGQTHGVCPNNPFSVADYASGQIITLAAESDNGGQRCFYATDTAGNRAVAGSAAFAGISVDTTLQAISITTHSSSLPTITEGDSATGAIFTLSGISTGTFARIQFVQISGVCLRLGSSFQDTVTADPPTDNFQVGVTDDMTDEVDCVIEATVLPDPADTPTYRVGSPSSARITVVDDDLPPSDAPTAVVLDDASNGGSNSDTLTNVTTPIFRISGLVSGATVAVQAMLPFHSTRTAGRAHRKMIVVPANSNSVIAEFAMPGEGGQCSWWSVSPPIMLLVPRNECRFMADNGDGDWIITATQTAPGMSVSDEAALTVTLDTAVPTVQIEPTDIVKGVANEVTFTWSEAVTGFALADIRGGADSTLVFSDFVEVSDTVYRVNVTDNVNDVGVGGVVRLFGNAVRDVAGNGNGITPDVEFTFVAAPLDPSAKPTIDLVAASDTGSSTTDNITNDPTPTFTVGNVVVGAVVQLFTENADGTRIPIGLEQTVGDGTPVEPCDGTRRGTCNISGNSVDIIAASFLGADGEYDIVAVQTEPSKGAVASDPLSVTIDFTAPALSLLPASISLAEGATTTITVSVSEPLAAPLASGDFTVSGGGTLSAPVAVAGTNDYTVDFVAGNSPTTASISIGAGAVTDVAGNGNTATGTLEITIVEPSSKPTVDLQAASDTGSEDDDNITNDRTPTFVVSDVVGGAAVQVNLLDSDGDSSALLGTVGASDTSITLSASPLADGEWTVTATHTETGGAMATDSDRLVLTIDTVRPTVMVTPASVVRGVETELTFTWSEAVTGFERSDIQNTSADESVIGLNPTSDPAEYTTSFTPNTANPAMLFTKPNEIADIAGNMNERQTLEIAVTNPPSSKPTVALAAGSDTGSDPADRITNAFTPRFLVTGVVSEASVTLVGSQSATTFTVSAPVPENETSVTISVSNSLLDPQGEWSIVATHTAPDRSPTDSDPLVFTYDRTNPVLMTVAPTAAFNGGTRMFTFTWDEDVVDFALADISTDVGTVVAGSFTGSGSVYRASITAPASGNSMEITVANGVTDVAGNATSVGFSNTITLSADTTGPTVMLSAAETTIDTGVATVVTIEINEAATGFAVGDVAVAPAGAGSLSNFLLVPNSTNYTVTFTAGSSATTATISVGAGAFTDAAGNGNSASNRLSIAVEVTVATAPTVTITAGATSLTTGGTTTVTFTISEPTDDFVAGDDVTVSGGSVGVLTAVANSDNYTATFTAGASPGTASISVAAGVFTDTAGNDNTASNVVMIEVTASSTTPPTLPTVTIAADATSVPEGTAAIFTISAAPPPDGAALVVMVNVSDGAGNFIDGTAPGMVTIADGAGSVKLSVATED